MSLKLRDIFTVGAGGMIAQLVTASSMPVVTRLYSPDAYAGWALMMAIVVIFTSVATFRYELAIVLPDKHEEAINVMAVCLVATIGMSLMSCMIVYFGKSWLIGEKFNNELSAWIWCVPFLILTMGIYQTFNLWCTRMREFRWYALLQVILPLLTIISQITLALLGFATSSGLILGSLLGQGIAVGFLTVLIYKKYGTPIIHAFSVQQMKFVSGKYRVYPFYMTPYTLMGTIRDRYIYFLLASFGIKAEVGFYNLSTRLVNIPNSLVGSAIRPVFYQKAASTDLRRLEKTINDTMKLLAVSMVPFWILFLFNAEFLFSMIFGAPWRKAGLYASVLSVPYFFLFLTNWLDRSFDALGRQRLAFLLELIFSVLLITVLTISMLTLKDTFIAICLQAGVITAYYLIWLVVLFRIAGMHLKGITDLVLIIVGIGTVWCLLSWMLMVILPPSYSLLVNIFCATVVTGIYLYKQWDILKIR